jgi:hypothetical protein
LNEKIKKSMPSEVLEERCLQELMEEASQSMGMEFESAWLLDGAE